MRSMRGRGRWSGLLVGVVLIAAACSPNQVAPTPTPRFSPSPTPAGVTVVRWMVGLGKGTEAAQIDAEKAFVKSYNEAQKGIYIDLEIVPNDMAFKTLKAEIANGTAPDIVGPIGIRGRNGLSGSFVDLSSEIADTNYDMTGFPQGVVDQLKDGGNLVGIPYLINPAFIFYNKDIFSKMKLPDLPKRVGDSWNGKPWTWDALASLAYSLTVDEFGHSPASARFVQASGRNQYGFDFQWSDLRRTASCFQAGSLLGPGNTAVIPDAWRAAWRWYYSAMWGRRFAPTLRVANSPLLAYGSTVASGKVAMAVSWPWAIKTYAGAPDTYGSYNPRFSSWDIAVLPQYNGQTTSPTDSDSFSIVKGTLHPDQAFEAMVAIMNDPTLRSVYGGMPAAKPDQAAWFAQFDTYLSRIYPSTKVSWTVLQEMENYPANPSPDMDLPAFEQANVLTANLYQRMQTIEGLDLDREEARLQSSLQRAFQQATATPSP